MPVSVNDIYIHAAPENQGQSVYEGYEDTM